MNKLTFAKFFGGLCILLAIFATVLDCLTFLSPIGSYLLIWDSNPETVMTKFKIIIYVLFIIGLLPLIFGLISFYLADGIGNSWFAKILLSSFLFAILLLLIFGGINTFVVSKDTQQIVTLIVSLMMLYIILSLIIFSITALIVGKVSLWKRIIPLASFILWIILPIVLGIIAWALIGGLNLGSILPIDLYAGAREATIPQWLMIGSIAWALLGSLAFMKNKKSSVLNNNLSAFSSPSVK